MMFPSIQIFFLQLKRIVVSLKKFLVSWQRVAGRFQVEQDRRQCVMKKVC